MRAVARRLVLCFGVGCRGVPCQHATASRDGNMPTGNPGKTLLLVLHSSLLLPCKHVPGRMGGEAQYFKWAPSSRGLPDEVATCIMALHCPQKPGKCLEDPSDSVTGLTSPAARQKKSPTHRYSAITPFAFIQWHASMATAKNQYRKPGPKNRKAYCLNERRSGVLPF